MNVGFHGIQRCGVEAIIGGDTGRDELGIDIAANWGQLMGMLMLIEPPDSIFSSRPRTSAVMVMSPPGAPIAPRFVLMVMVPFRLITSPMISSPARAAGPRSSACCG